MGSSKPGCRPECGQWVHLSLGVGQSVGQGASSAWPRGARWPRLQHLDVRYYLARLL